MNLERMNLTQKEIWDLKAKSKMVYFNSGLEFLNQHKGLRPHTLHLLIGMPSGGKSTLRNTIIFDFIKNNNKTVYLHLSEEKLDHFKTDLSKANSELERHMRQLVVYSEADNVGKVNQKQDAINTFKQNVLRSKCDLIVLDNITTSRMYGSTFNDNEQFCWELKNMTSSLKQPMVVIAHTSSAIKYNHDSLIDINDIRGSKTLTNIAEIQYVLQSINCANGLNTVLRIGKHRGIEVNEKIFLLPYDSKQMLYKGTIPLSFEELKKLWSVRKKLNDKKN